MTNITAKNKDKKKSKLSPQDWVTVVSGAIVAPLSIFIIIGLITGAGAPHTGGW